jgi:cytochrome c
MMTETNREGRAMKPTSAILNATLAALAVTSCSKGKDASDQIHGLAKVERQLDSAKGRALFVEKGCVMCHSVNGVGGKAAPVLDAQIGAPPVDPLDFAARMWAGAPAMIELQSMELGYTISLTGDEIANIAAFTADREEQKKLTVEQIPEPMRGSLLDERFWEVEDWDEFLKSGQEGYEPPKPGSDSTGDEPPAPPAADPQ